MENQERLTPFQKQIYPMLQEKETEALLQIWQENDRREWSEDAFRVIRSILLERLGEVPDQGTPKNADGNLEFIQPGRKIISPARIAEWSSWLSWTILAFAFLLGILRFFSLLNSSEPFPFIFGLLSIMENLLLAGSAFLLLQGLAAILAGQREP